VAPGWLDPYIVGHYRLEVANNVFNGMGTPDVVVLPRHTRSAAWRRAVGSPGTVTVPDEWSTVLVLHCSRMSTRFAGIDCATCPHVLQTHDSPDVKRLGNVCVCVGNIRA
jgi:hypothetical protein